MGALTIPEILRYVPGLEVSSITSSHAEVSIRGLSQVPSNNVLVMIDGRSVYIDYYGGVVWESLPILIEQIDRIEIMRSPGSALYGANAFSGVINILTKTPNQIQGQKLFLRAGEYNTLNGGTLLGGTKGSSGYRLALGAKHIDSFKQGGDPSNPSEDMFIGNVYFDHSFRNNTKLLFDAGLSNGFVHKIFLTDPNKSKALNTYSKFKLSHGNYYLQAYWNRGDQNENTFIPAGRVENIFYNTFDIEAQGTCNLKESNSLVYGLSYRLNSIRSNVLDKKHKQDLYALFLQDEMKIIPELSLLLGTRVDWHPLVDTKVSPRGSIIYSPVKSHTFRLTAGKAFRNPTFINSYIDYKSLEGIEFLGNTSLKPENIITYEAAYLFVPAKRTRFEVDLFHSKFKDYIFLDETGTFDPFNPFSTLGKIFNNRGHANISGAEFSLDLIPMEMVKLGANYSTLYVLNRYTKNSQQKAPKNTANLIFNLNLPQRIKVNLSTSYIGKSSWSVANKYGLYEMYSVGSHTRVDFKIGYSSKSAHSEFFVAVFNLFDNDKIEYPLSEPMQRRITANFHLAY